MKERKEIGNGKYRIRVKQSIEAETVSDRVLYLLRTIESGGGDRKERKLTRMKEARREHVIVPVTSVLHLNSLIKVVVYMDRTSGLPSG